MQLTSTAFSHEGKIPSKYTCDGKNINPPLKISGVPGNAESLVLILEDPDVPRNIREDGMWDHWVVFDIPPDTREIPEDREPPGTPGKGTAGNTGYYGPCPPDREHRYFFKLTALDAKLDLPKGSDKRSVHEAMDGKIIAESVLMGTYERR